MDLEKQPQQPIAPAGPAPAGIRASDADRDRIADILRDAMAEGRLTAVDLHGDFDTGAYADIGPRVTQKSGFTAAGPYDIEHVSLDN